ncbi:TetR/AcrR family transcriptional regulator [Glycomyces sp. NRRL B-16210]|uniref:TetR/AcrR family transcriptional regulator n=1 Tax=Glycomyces sp. NRRL B-16210 TaxID=1463821 RepID=UPI0004C0D76A|nr:TetR/AcrR family transcriptional regulator [Glycomyces sp. NRRL B-16210]
MTVEPGAAPRRTPLTKESVLRAAVAMADEPGAGLPSMRNLADRLGVKAMALYHHFKNKDALIDGMVDLVFSEVELPRDDDADWRPAMRRRAVSMRDALTRHPWAIGLMDSRTNPGLATLHHHNAVIGCLRAGGFTIAGAAHSFSLLDGYIYGFTLQELSLPFENQADIEGLADTMFTQYPFGDLPHLTEMMLNQALQPGYDYAEEFAIGLDLILDGLSRKREAWT